MGQFPVVDIRKGCGHGHDVVHVVGTVRVGACFDKGNTIVRRE